ncbi:MAG: transcription elongation factor GreA [Treponema sp.]|nr:transcription elongation factor GreA [Spirochaetales bacterium]MDY6191303.1 transcription elongation factor GreA [Treponema sp.]
MAELVQSVQDMLKEETWTRATISNYTQNNLKEFANIVEKAHSENCADEIYDICQEHLSHSKDSIIALYICGILDLQKGSLDNSSLVTLVDIFKNNHKEPIVTYLCESILEDDPNNKFALRTLAEGYRAEGNEKYWDLYAQIVKIDFEEADLARLLAEHYEEAGDVDMTVSYYKKAILRYINNSNYNAIKEVWSKLIQYIPQEIDFFQLLRRKISKQMGDIRTTTLMQELYNWYKDNAPSKKEYWDVAITILKQNLEVEPKDIWARKEIADCFRGKYKEHSHLEEYIRTSNLTQSYRNVFEAINDFEKHIAFDKGSYVFHRNWGVGRIRKLDGDALTINFGRVVGIKEMKLSMAVTALKPLAKDHIWVLKATMQKEDLIKSVKADKAETLKIIIRSFDNNCDFKRIKAELVPSILTPGEWTSWNSAAKKILETDSSFGVNPNDISMYTVRDGNISPEEKISNEFKAQKQFFARADLLVKFFESDDTDNSSELFAEMYSYFTGYLKNISKVNEQVLASYLLVRSISAIDKQFAFPVKETFAEIYNRIEDPKEIYLLLKDSKSTHFKEDFIRCIKLLPNWNEEYVKLFPIVLKEELLNDLIKEGHVEDVQKLVRTSFEAFKDFRETVLFFFKECQDKDWFNEAGVSYEKQLITLINIIELTFREINNHVNSTENKKINKNATDLLFKTDAIFNYMFANGEDAVKKMYTLIDDISDIDPSYKALARNKILEKYPDFKFRVSEEKKQQSVGLIVTAKKLAEKKAEVDEIQNVLIPKNAAEVADAKAKGDLKENQEYKSAKEEQHFLNLKLTNLQNELNRAVVFDPTTSTTAIISFGTVATLKDNQTGNEETYTILGPWESDPDNNVISYMAPFGDAILNKKVGDILQFTINEHKYDYTVKNISKAKDI